MYLALITYWCCCLQFSRTSCTWCRAQDGCQWRVCTQWSCIALGLELIVGQYCTDGVAQCLSLAAGRPLRPVGAQSLLQAHRSGWANPASAHKNLEAAQVPGDAGGVPEQLQTGHGLRLVSTLLAEELSGSSRRPAIEASCSSGALSLFLS
jgi:hypothetical protein